MKKNSKTKNILLAILIGSAVISFWRGLWGLMDIYLFPKNPALSFSISVIIGLIILIITHYTTKELM